MKEKINNLEIPPISNKENNLKQECNIEISKKEKREFAILDKFGDVGKNLLSQFYDRYLPKTFIADSLDGDFNIDLELEGIEKLTVEQKTFLESVLEKIKYDHAELMKTLDRFDKSNLLRQLHKDLLIQSKDGTLDPTKVNISLVPGGIGMLINDRNYFNENFPNSEHLAGFYRRCEGYNNTSKFIGRIFVVDATKETVVNIFRHEYLHLLTYNYIEPYELPQSLPIDVVPIQKKLDQYNGRIAELYEETDYVEYDEVLAIQQEIGDIRKEMATLQMKKEKIIDNSESYLTDEAKDLFKEIRNELSAYAVGGEFKTREDAFFPQNTTWSEKVSQIKHEKDRIKLMEQWGKLKSVIHSCMESKVSPDDVLHIFLTSQNFEQMAKRLLLFV